MFKMTTVSVNAQFKTFDASFDHSSALFNRNCLGVSSNRIFHASSIMVIFCHHLLFKMSPQVKIWWGQIWTVCGPWVPGPMKSASFAKKGS